MEPEVMRPVHTVLAAGLIAACPSSQVIAQIAAEQRVELSNFDFSPRELHLHAGQPVALVLANLASGGHDFAAPEFFAAARVQPGDAGLVVDGEVEVPARSTRTVHLVPAAGTYRLNCTHTFHTMFGMKGTIIVE
jgi:plastocyanin